MNIMDTMIQLATDPVQQLIRHTIETLDGDGVFVPPADWMDIPMGRFPIMDASRTRVADVYLALGGMEKKDEGSPPTPQMVDLFSRAIKFVSGPLLGAAGLDRRFALQEDDGNGYRFDDRAPLRLWIIVAPAAPLHSPR